MKTNDADISEAAEGEFAPGMLKQAAERELAAGVLKQATQDLRRFHAATSKVERELYIDAIAGSPSMIARRRFHF